MPAYAGMTLKLPRVTPKTIWYKAMKLIAKAKLEHVRWDSGQDWIKRATQSPRYS